MPGILLMTIAGSAGGTAITVAMDMTEGITARFRTMAISRAAVLAGHVLGNTIQAIIAVALVLGVGLLIGFRPTAGAARVARRRRPDRAASRSRSAGSAVAMGMQAKSVETASNLPLLLLPPAVPRQRLRADRVDAARGCSGSPQYQPFTPFIETVRGLLLGTPLGWNPVLAIGWCVVIAVGGYVWSMAIYERKSVR